MRSLLSIGTVVLVAGMSASFATAAVIYDSNGFESTGTPAFTIGTLAGQNGWSSPASVTGAVVVENTKAYAGTQAVELPNTAGGSSGGRAIARYTLSVPQDHWVDVWVLPPAGNQIQVNPVINLRDSKGIEVSFQFTAAGTIVGTSAHYNVGQWNRVTIFIDRTNDNWDGYLNGVQVLSNQAFAISGHSNPIDINTYDIDWTGKAPPVGDPLSSFYADNFKITTTNPIPEPATVGMLMSVGGLALLKRHR